MGSTFCHLPVFPEIDLEIHPSLIYGAIDKCGEALAILSYTFLELAQVYLEQKLVTEVLLFRRLR